MEEGLDVNMVVELNMDLEDLACMYLHDYNLVEVEDNLVAEEDNLVAEEDNWVAVGENLMVEMEYRFEHVGIFHHLQNNLIENHHY
jgi:hypothetical protein